MNRTLPCPHQLPAGCSASIQVTGYNHRICTLVTPRGEFHGAGHSDWAALSKARQKAVEAGVEL